MRQVGYLQESYQDARSTKQISMFAVFRTDPETATGRQGWTNRVLIDLNNFRNTSWMIQTTVSVSVQPDLRGQYRKNNSAFW